MPNRNSSNLLNTVNQLARSDLADEIRKNDFLCNDVWPQPGSSEIEVFATPQAAAIAVLRNQPVEPHGTYSVLWLLMADGRDGFAATRGANVQMVLTNINGLITFFVTRDMQDRRWIRRTEGLFPMPSSMRPWLPRAYSGLPRIPSFGN